MPQKIKEWPKSSIRYQAVELLAVMVFLTVILIAAATFANSYDSLSWSVPYIFSAPMWLWAGFSVSKIFQRFPMSEKISSILFGLSLVLASLPLFCSFGTVNTALLISLVPISLLFSFVIEVRNLG